MQLLVAKIADSVFRIQRRVIHVPASSVENGRCPALACMWDFIIEVHYASRWVL
jgi:hypothetical protein